MKSKILLTFFVIVAISQVDGLFGVGSKQKMRVKGQLFCGTNPATNVLVRLVDDDTGAIFKITLQNGQITLN